MFTLVRPLAVAASLLGFTAGAALAADCTQAVPDSELVQKGTLVMSTNPTLPPLQYVDSSGDLKGMRIAMGLEIAKRLCLKPDYVRIDFDAMVPGLQSGRWDMINTGIFFTPERAKIMQMIPYEQQAISISVANDFKKDIAKKEDLAGMTIGVEIGGFEESKTREMDKALKAEGLKGLDIRTFDSFALAYQALRAGQVDGVVSIDAVAAEYAHRGDFKQALSGLYPAPVAVAFKSPALADAVAKVMNDMRADGTMKKLFDEYGMALSEGDYKVVGPAE